MAGKGKNKSGGLFKGSTAKSKPRDRPDRGGKRDSSYQTNKTHNTERRKPKGSSW
jgi:hypothetical protein